MPQVSINIANRTYELACGEGEEPRVHELATYVDEKVSQLRRLKQLEDENRKLKQLVGELSLDNAALKDVVAKKW